MYLMGIEVTFHFYYLESLKDKRRIVKSIVDHVRSRYKISAAEVGYLDSLERGALGFGIVSNNRKHSEQVLQTVINHIDIQSEIEIIDIEWMEA
jgi:hypothetical protein